MSSIFDSIFEELDQILGIVSPNRKFSETHKSILMKSRIFALKTKLNQTILADDVDPETRIRGYLKTIEKLKKILSYQHHESTALYWFELHMFHQLLIAHIIMINGSGGKLGVIGLAHALADLLVGLDVKNPMKLLTDPEDPEWSTRINIAYNIANGQVSLYATLMEHLFFMPKNEAMEFTNNILEGMAYVEDLLQKTWNPEKILKSRTSIASEDEKVESILVLANAAYNLAIAHYNFWPRFGLKLEGIRSDLKEKHAITASEFFERVKGLLKQTDERIKELREYMSRDRELKNVDLDQFSSFKFSQMQKAQVEQITLLTEAIHKTITEKSIPSNSLELIRGLHNLLAGLAPYLKNEELIYNSAIGEIFASFATYYLYLSGYFAIRLRDKEILGKTQDHLGIFLKPKGKTHFPLVHVYNYIATLSVDATLCPENLVSEEYAEIQKGFSELIENLNFYPREKLGLSALSTILSFYRNERFEENLRNLQKIVEDYGIEGEIKETLMQFCTYIERKANGEDAIIERNIEPAALDHFSVLLPNFTKVAEITEKPILEYFPLNSLQFSVYERD